MKYKFKNYEPSIITIYNRDGEALMREPSLMAIDTEIHIVRAIGKDAPTAVKGTPWSETTIIGSPFRNGIVADFEQASTMFKIFLKYVKKTKKLRWLMRPRIAVCVPVDMTPVEHTALKELILRVGARSVLIFEESFEGAVRNIPQSYKIIIEILPNKSGNLEA